MAGLLGRKGQSAPDALSEWLLDAQAPLVRLDQVGVISGWSKGAEGLLGWTWQDTLNRPLAAVLAGSAWGLLWPDGQGAPKPALPEPSLAPQGAFRVEAIGANRRPVRLELMVWPTLDGAWGLLSVARTSDAEAAAQVARAAQAAQATSAELHELTQRSQAVSAVLRSAGELRGPDPLHYDAARLAQVALGALEEGPERSPLELAWAVMGVLAPRLRAGGELVAGPMSSAELRLGESLPWLRNWLLALPDVLIYHEEPFSLTVTWEDQLRWAFRGVSVRDGSSEAMRELAARFQGVVELGRGEVILALEATAPSWEPATAEQILVAGPHAQEAARWLGTTHTCEADQLGIKVYQAQDAGKPYRAVVLAGKAGEYQLSLPVLQLSTDAGQLEPRGWVAQPLPARAAVVAELGTLTGTGPAAGQTALVAEPATKLSDPEGTTEAAGPAPDSPAAWLNAVGVVSQDAGLIALLSELGYDVDASATEVGAVACALHGQVAALVLDHRVADVVRLAQVVRRQELLAGVESTARLPMFALSWPERELSRAAARDAGLDGVVAGPANAAELGQLLSAAKSWRTEANALGSEAAAPELWMLSGEPALDGAPGEQGPPGEASEPEAPPTPFAPAASEAPFAPLLADKPAASPLAAEAEELAAELATHPGAAPEDSPVSWGEVAGQSAEQLPSPFAPEPGPAPALPEYLLRSPLATEGGGPAAGFPMLPTEEDPLLTAPRPTLAEAPLLPMANPATPGAPTEPAAESFEPATAANLAALEPAAELAPERAATPDGALASPELAGPLPSLTPSSAEPEVSPMVALEAPPLESYVGDAASEKPAEPPSLPRDPAPFESGAPQEPAAPEPLGTRSDEVFEPLALPEPRDEENPPDPATEPSLFELAQVAPLIALGQRKGKDVVGPLYAVYWEQSPARLTELVEATVAQNAMNAAGSAHTLKGSSAQLGAAGVARAALAVEVLCRKAASEGWEELDDPIADAVDELLSVFERSYAEFETVRMQWITPESAPQP